jgi:hypothetical protein
MSNLIQGAISSFSVEEHIKYSGLSDLAISVIELAIEETQASTPNPDSKI